MPSAACAATSGTPITSVSILALTIGATTTTFSIVNGVLLKPLAYRESHQLVALREVVLELAGQYPVVPVNGHHFEEWRSQAQTFEALAEYLPMSANLTGAGDPVQVDLVRTSGALFDVLQVAADARPRVARRRRAARCGRRRGAGASPLARALRRRYRSIVGRAIDARRKTLHRCRRASGDLSASDQRRSCQGRCSCSAKVDALVPLRLPDGLGWVGDFNHVAIGRLKAGVTIEQAEPIST